MNAAIGPLFAGPPGAHGIPWMHVLPILVAVPAAALLLWGLLRGRLAPAVGALAVLLPIAVAVSGLPPFGLFVSELTILVGGFTSNFALVSVVMLAALWRRVGPGLRIPIAVYVAAILAMGTSALTTSSLSLIGGAILFMASDGLLATEKFLVAAISAHRAWMRFAVWALYYAAQLAITLGFLLS